MFGSGGHWRPGDCGSAFASTRFIYYSYVGCQDWLKIPDNIKVRPDTASLATGNLDRRLRMLGGTLDVSAPLLQAGSRQDGVGPWRLALAFRF